MNGIPHAVTIFTNHKRVPMGSTCRGHGERDKGSEWVGWVGGVLLDLPLHHLPFTLPRTCANRSTLVALNQGLSQADT